jgi:hypothetical protein
MIGCNVWNCQDHGVIISAGGLGISIDALTVYDCGKSAVFFASGGAHSLTGSNLRNNGRLATGSTTEQAAVVVSASIESLTVSGNVMFDDALGTQLRGIVSGSGAPRVNLGANDIRAPVSAVFFTDYTNVRFHGLPFSVQIKHPGFLADGRIDMGANPLWNVGAISRSAWAAGSVVSNTLVCGNEDMIVMNAATMAAITDITSALPGIPIITIRNNNAAPMTFTHNIAKLRNNSGADVVLAQYRSVQYAFVSGTVWQQI